MLWTFIGAIMTAVLAACVAFVVLRLTGRNIRWVIPTSAGAAMLAFTVWNDYTWFDRTAGALPESFVVTTRRESAHAMQPWTFLWPAVSGFATVDLGSARRHPDHPGLVIADLYLLERFTPTRVAPQMIDCAAAARADLPPDATFDADGRPVGLGWVDLPSDHPLLAAVCLAEG